MDLVTEGGGNHWEWLALHLEDPDPLRLLLSIFSHANWMHYAGNMLYLWVFGVALEDRLGAKKFLVLFVACGVLGSLIELSLFWAEHAGDATVPARWGLGASGAVFGIMGLTLARFPRAKVTFVGSWLTGSFLPYQSFWISLKWFMGWRIFLEILNALVGGDHVDHLAHILGCAIGLGAARLLKLRDAGEDEVLELQAESHADAGDFRGAVDAYNRLLALRPKRGLFRLKRADALQRSWRGGSGTDGGRKDVLAQWQRGMELSLAENKAAEALEWLQHFIPPFSLDDLEPGLRHRLDLARKQVADLGSAAPLSSKARFLDADDRLRKLAQARQELQASASGRDWPRAAQAAELMHKLLDAKEWTVQEMLWGGEALRQSGASAGLWEDLLQTAARQGGEDETLKALLALERAWKGSTRHADLGAQIRKAGERLPGLAGQMPFQDLRSRVERY
jgi:membrane associated rhomboid family serine protease